jgi:hypothetical protein
VGERGALDVGCILLWLSTELIAATVQEQLLEAKWACLAAGQSMQVVTVNCC